jgi:hypothetical protein
MHKGTKEDGDPIIFLFFCFWGIQKICVCNFALNFGALPTLILAPKVINVKVFGL